MRYINDLTSDVSGYTKSQKDILLYATNRHWGVPVFKIDNFVGGAQFTPFGKLRQLLLELGSRENMISDQELKIERTKLEIELEKERIQLSSSPVEIKIHELNIKEKERLLLTQKNSVSLIYEERDKYMMLIDKFNNSEEGKLPDGRLIMDIIGNHEEEERLEAELWGIRLGAQAAYDLMFYGRVNGGNMEAIDQLPKEVREIALEHAVFKAIETNKQLDSLQIEVKKRLELADSETNLWEELE
jgi:hypothetical protein